MQYLLFYVLALFAEVVGTVGGFGSSVFFVPIANQFFSFHEVLGITAMLHVFSNLSKLLLFRHGIDKKLLMQLGIPAVVFVLIGGFLTRYFDNTKLELFLGIFLVLTSLWFLINRSDKVEATRRNAISGGILSGFMAGFLGTGGAIRGLTMAAFAMPKSIFIATSAAIDMGVDVSRAVIYLEAGYWKAENWVLLPWLIAISFVGSYLGKRILNHVSEDRFRTISLYLICLVGILSMVKPLMALFSS
ncbi:MAG: sulfite exporter TauE/SafE family protein [Bacteroidetes bacterium]|nr:MAG: sulfite exporter TauE/SafE family protein [Bacteroidota bacterium]